MLRLSAEISTVLRQPEVTALLAGQGSEVATGMAEEFAAYLRAEYEK